MQSLTYDVAVSADGYIALPDGSFDLFPPGGPQVEAYLDRLSAYDTVVMGRRTYEVGLNAGLPVGQRPYPHMHTVVFSTTLPDTAGAAIELCRTDPVARVEALKTSARGPLYLCGGGMLAGALLAAGLIDRLIIKRAPLVLGRGIPLFAGVKPVRLHRLDVNDPQPVPFTEVYTFS
jgi:dihydrofolate reductase